MTTKWEWLARFGRAVQEARQARGLPVAELAQMVTIPSLFLMEIEAGRRDVAGSMVAQLISVLGIAAPSWETVPGLGAERLTAVTDEVRRIQGEVRSARMVLAGARRR